jgi:hypothetical protein
MIIFQRTTDELIDIKSLNWKYRYNNQLENSNFYHPNDTNNIFKIIKNL